MKYIPIKLTILKNNYQAPCDISIQLSEEKYVCVIKANDFYDEDDIIKISKKGIQDIFIKEKDKNIFNLHFDKKLHMELSSSGDENDRALRSAYQRVLNFAQKIELSVENIELIQGIQNQSIQLIKKGNKDIFELLIKNIKDGNYISDHSMMTSLIACSVAKKIRWSSNSNLNKFILASLFHDLSIKDERMAKVNYISEAIADGFSNDELVIIQDHPHSSVEIFAKTKINNSDVEKMILLHHELPDGSGFPGTHDAFTLPPNICLFILAHEFVNTMIENNFEDEAWNELELKFSDYYHKGNFLKPLKGFYQLFPRLKK